MYRNSQLSVEVWIDNYFKTPTGIQGSSQPEEFLLKTCLPNTGNTLAGISF